MKNLRALLLEDLTSHEGIKMWGRRPKKTKLELDKEPKVKIVKATKGSIFPVALAQVIADFVQVKKELEKQGG